MEQYNEKIGTRKDLVSYRIETAKSDLKSAKILLNAGEYKGANNRAYYAIFHLNVIKMQLPISIKIMLRQRFFREKWVEKSVRQKRYGMPVIMMIFILQVKKRQSGRLQLQENL